MKLSRFNYSDFYIVLWLLYYTFEYMKWPSVIQIGILGLLYAWSLYCAFLIHVRIKATGLIKGFDFLIVILTIYYGFYYLQHGTTINVGGVIYKVSNFIFQIFSSLLSFYAFYWFSLKGNLSLTTIRKWSVFFFGIAIWDFFFQQQKGLEMLLGNNNPDIDMEVVNNGSYKILALVPIIGLFNKKLFQLAGLMVCMYFILISFKRGPLLILTICILYYYIKLSRKNKIWTVIAFMITVYIGLFWIQGLMFESDMFMFKLQKTLDGNSSGRDIISEKLFSHIFMNMTPKSLIFGYGANATLHISGRLAHSDWIEILVNMGIIGIAIYSNFCYQMVKFWRRVRNNMDVCLPVGLFCIVFLMKSVFSMAYDQIPFYEMLVFAFFAGKTDVSRVKNL